MADSLPSPIAIQGSQRLLIPAYFRPTGTRWQDTCNAINNHLVTAVLVMNPDNGPGTALHDMYSNYLSAMDVCQGRRQTVIGYVPTDYGEGNIPLESAKAHINTYYDLFPRVRGIFLDEMSNKPERKPYYRELYAHVKAKSSTALVVGNAGIPATRGGPLNDGAWQVTAPIVADVIVVFEGPYERTSTDPADRAQYKDWFPPNWVSSRPSSTFAHIIYESPNATTTREICIASQQKNAGWIYVTEDRRPNPWDSPPDETLIGSPTLAHRPVIKA
jgi:hypothetical protein